MHSTSIPTCQQDTHSQSFNDDDYVDGDDDDDDNDGNHKGDNWTFSR